MVNMSVTTEFFEFAFVENPYRIVDHFGDEEGGREDDAFQDLSMKGQCDRQVLFDRTTAQSRYLVQDSSRICRYG